MTKKLFEYIYTYANKLREATVSDTAEFILKTYDKLGNDPHRIQDAGRIFNRSVDKFQLDSLSEINKEYFVFKLYEKFLEYGFKEFQCLNFIYYYFKPAIKRFQIPETYQKIKYYTTTVKGTTYLKSIEIPRSKGLYIYLVDVIENFLKLKDIFLKSKLDKTLSEIMSQGEILNTVTDSKLISEIKNIEDKDQE